MYSTCMPAASGGFPGPPGPPRIAEGAPRGHLHVRGTEDKRCGRDIYDDGNHLFSVAMVGIIVSLRVTLVAPHLQDRGIHDGSGWAMRPNGLPASCKPADARHSFPSPSPPQGEHGRSDTRCQTTFNAGAAESAWHGGMRSMTILPGQR